MADKKISQFTQATALDPTDLFVIQRGANNFSISGEKLINFVSLTTQEEGVDVDTSTNLINFIGTGVTASAGASPGEVDVTIPGDKIATQDTNALVQSPTATEDGYFIAWNDTNQEYELVLGGASALNDLTDVNVTGAAQGAILYKSATDWVHLAAGTSGQVLQTNGAGADPSWVNSGGNTIYNADDSLTGTRTVTMGEFNLNFSHNGVTTAKNQSIVYKTDQTDKQMRFEVTNDSVDNTKLFMKIIGSTYVSGTIDNYYKAKGIVQGGLDHDLLLVSQGTGGVEILTGDTNLATGVTKRAMSISSAQVVTLDNLSGVGSRMVVADASGVLSTQAIPGGGGNTIYSADDTLAGARTVNMGGNTLTFNKGTAAGNLVLTGQVSATVQQIISNTQTTGFRSAAMILQDNVGSLVALTRTDGTGTDFNDDRSVLYSTKATGLGLGATNASGDLWLYAGGEAATNRRMVMTSDGFVGVVDDSEMPNTDFHVIKNKGASTVQLIVEHTEPVGTNYQGALLAAVNPQGYVRVFNHQGGVLGTDMEQDRGLFYSNKAAGTVLGATNAAGSLFFYTGGEAAGNKRMTIGSTGLVGINTVPTLNTQVHISGASGNAPLRVDTNTINNALTVGSNGKVGIGVSPGNNALHIVSSRSLVAYRSNGTSLAYTLVNTEDFGDTVKGSILNLYQDGNATPLVQLSSRDGSVPGPPKTEDSWINNGGKFGINTDTPQHELDVNSGRIRIGNTVGTTPSITNGGVLFVESNNLYYRSSTGTTTLIAPA